METAIETKNLTKYYPAEGIRKRFIATFTGSKIGEKLALDNLNLKVYKGEIFGFLGPNGAGKSTFIKILSTIILPTSGRAYIFGYDVVREAKKVRSLIGVMPEIPQRGFYRRLNLRENLIFYARVYGVKNAVEIVDQLIEEYDLKEVSDKWFQKLSRGEKQKASLLRALVSNTPLLLLDEPTLGLDIVSARKIKRKISDKFGRDDLTIFLTTHNMRVAEEICDRIGIINKGKLIAVDKTSEIINLVRKSGRSLLIVEVFNSVDVKKLLGDINGVFEIEKVSQG